jgi:hypothetical protein
LTPKLSPKSLGPLKISLEMAQKVIVPQKKIMSRSFLNSGTLIVIFEHKVHLTCHGDTLGISRNLGDHVKNARGIV